MKHSVSVTCCALLVSSISLSYAAEVPSGTVLAEKQELVRHIKDEPASLDPAKAVGLPEIQVGVEEDICAGEPDDRFGQ